VINDIYSLEELITNLEEISEKGGGSISIPKALLSLCYEMRKMQEEIAGKQDDENDYCGKI